MKVVDLRNFTVSSAAIEQLNVREVNCENTHATKAEQLKQSGNDEAASLSISKSGLRKMLEIDNFQEKKEMQNWKNCRMTTKVFWRKIFTNLSVLL